MRHLLIEKTGAGLRLALLEDRLLTDTRVIPAGGVLPEQIYLGRVERVAKGMGAVFVRLTDGQTGFLPASELKAPVQGGQDVLVQVKKPPVGEKAAYLTQEISLPGRTAILLPRGGARAVSSRVTDPAEKERLRALAAQLSPDRMGLIVRREAAGQPPEAVRENVSSLLSLWEKLEKDIRAGGAPRLVWPGRSPARQALDDWPDIGRVTVSDPELLPLFPDIPGDCAKDPFSLFSVNDQLRRLSARRVWLPSGGFVVVDPCEALTAIDVNSGKNAGTKAGGREALFLKTNLEAARLIARLIRVRGLGGIIVIDFIDMETEDARRQVLEAMTRAVLDDPVKCVVHGFTGLGLMEMTRKKTDAVPRAAAWLPCPACGGSGLVPEGNSL